MEVKLYYKVGVVKIQQVGFWIRWVHFPITLCVRSHQKTFQLPPLNISSPLTPLEIAKLKLVRLDYIA